MRILVALVVAGAALAAPKPVERFLASDRCQACHNGLLTPSGKDVSIGFHWRATMMANSARDPYWHASVRREVIDHPESQAAIEDECAACHMPMARYQAKMQGAKGQVFAHLPVSGDQASDGVSCSVCHQMTTQGFGKPESYNGSFVIKEPDAQGLHTEYGPYDVSAGHSRIMRSSTERYRPEQTTHIREAELCAGCHTLITAALGPGGKEIGSLSEQMPYPEWLHSGYRNRQSCQSCHMPLIEEPSPITRVLGEPREGARLHSFTGANFFMLGLLNRFRAELGVTALPNELSRGVESTLAYLRDQAATIAIEKAVVNAQGLSAEIVVHNRGGHKLPTAYPSRRAWIHFIVRDRSGRVVFESGRLNADGSIAGNPNDADPNRFEPHHREIRSAEEVQIYEAVAGGADGKPTTGLLTAVRYLKDNRLLPDGFDKRTADSGIAVVGDALEDPAFSEGGHRVRYVAGTRNSSGPFSIEAELCYQPIGFRWANSLKNYAQAEEPRRFSGYYQAMQSSTATVLTRAVATIGQ